jgi:hypothetical protein
LTNAPEPEDLTRRAPDSGAPQSARKFIGAWKVPPDGDLDDLVQAIYDSMVESIREEEQKSGSES